MNIDLNFLENYFNSSNLDLEPATGGDIASSFLIKFEHQKYFFKQYSNSEQARQEVLGLEKLSESKLIKIPQVLTSSNGMILMEYFPTLSCRDSKAWFKTGESLARLHHLSHPHFGLTENNYIGHNKQQNSLIPINNSMDDWIRFFIEYRLNPMWDLCQKYFNHHHFQLFQNLKRKAESLFFNDLKQVRGSLLHGDLWGGNLIFSRNLEAVFIDPAIYYGHHEVDLAMTELFGGFQKDFYLGYNSILEIPEHYYQYRKDLYNSFHVLNHLSMFGTGYLSMTERYLQRLAQAN